eukprot:g2666.t1
MMRSGKVLCESVVKSFVARATHPSTTRLNATTEELYGHAIARAKEIDAIRAKPGHDIKNEPPLLGLPISVKSQYMQRDCQSDCGLGVRLLADPETEDGLLVAALVRAGAIPFVRTNVPQGLLVAESDNLIWGRSKNPFNESRTPGGSSGGEAALIATLASTVGLGTDIGGSIRIPAHNNGIYGLKPTAGRITSCGLAVPRVGNVSGQIGITSTAGPMARCVEDLVRVMKIWTCSDVVRSDPLVPPVPFRDEIVDGKKPLHIGYWTSDPYFPASEPCQRAVREAVEALRALGHIVVAVPILDSSTSQDNDDSGKDGFESFRDAFMIYLRIMGADAMRGIVDALENVEELLDAYKMLYTYSTIPNILRPLLGFVLENILGEPRKATLCRVAGSKSAYEYFRAIKAKKGYVKRYVDVWKRLRLDAVIVPGGALPALPHGAFRDLPLSFAYTVLFNLLNFPAGSVPVTRVRDSESDQYPSSKYDDSFDTAARVAMKGSGGMPVGVQVVALPFQDEIVLRVMRDIEMSLKKTNGGDFSLPKTVATYDKFAF